MAFDESWTCTELPQVTDKLCNNYLYRVQLTTFIVVIDTDYIGRYKSNYYTIMDVKASCLNAQLCKLNVIVYKMYTGNLE